MAAHSAAVPAGPFGLHDYRIECQPPESPRHVDIRSRAGPPLRVGDHYTIDPSGRLYDLVVETVFCSPGGQWSARCRVSPPAWP
ncbi:MAG: hypothetical protein ACXU82_07090 [Caulobacteraceae bacterium]